MQHGSQLRGDAHRHDVVDAAGIHGAHDDRVVSLAWAALRATEHGSIPFSRAWAAASAAMSAL